MGMHSAFLCDLVTCFHVGNFTRNAGRLLRQEHRGAECPGAPGRLALPTRQGLRAALRHLRDRAELLQQAQSVKVLP